MFSKIQDDKNNQLPREKKALYLNFYEEYNHDSWMDYVYYKLCEKLQERQTKIIFIIFASAILAPLWVDLLPYAGKAFIKILFSSDENYQNILNKFNDSSFKIYLYSSYLFFILNIIFIILCDINKTIPAFYMKHMHNKNTDAYRRFFNINLKDYGYIIINDTDKITDTNEIKEERKMFIELFNTYIKKYKETNQKTNGEFDTIKKEKTTLEERIKGLKYTTSALYYLALTYLLLTLVIYASLYIINISIYILIGMLIGILIIISFTPYNPCKLCKLFFKHLSIYL